MSGSIQSGILYPLTQTAFDNSQAGVNQVAQPTVLIGQSKMAQPYSLVPITSVPAARGMFGAGSILCRMFEAYFVNDQTGPILCLPQKDATGATSASGTMTIAGTANTAGTAFLYVGAQLVAVPISAGDTAAIIGANAVIVAAQQQSLPAVAIAAAGVITWTAKNAGTLGNLIDLRVNYLGLRGGQSLPSGIAIAVVAMSGGATDPDPTTIAAVLGDQSARFIVQPNTSTAYMAAMAAMMSFSGGRWAPNRKSRGHVWTAISNTIAALNTFGQSNNDPHSTVFAYEAGSPSPEWEAAAAYCGAAAASLRTQANQPLQTLNINGFSPPPAGVSEAAGGAFSRTTWQTLLGSGLALANYTSGNQPIIWRAPTTYQDNAYGQADQSYFDTETMYQLAAIADAIEGMETQKFGRSLLADDGNSFGPQIPVVTPKSALAEYFSLYLDLERQGLVEDPAAFLAATSLQRNFANPSELDTLFAPFLVSGLRQVNTTIQFRNYSAAAAAIVQQAAQ